MTDERTIVLVRHGETDWNLAGRMQGWAPVALNETGRRETQALGAHLASTYDFDRVIASDLRRTQETAALLGDAGVGPEPTFAEAWRERDLGVYQGFKGEAIASDRPALDPRSPDFSLAERPDDGESVLDLRDRVLDGWDRLLQADGKQETLVVTHGGPITVMLAVLSGQDLATAIQTWTVENCSITAVHLDTEDHNVSGEETRKSSPCTDHVRIQRAAERPPTLDEPSDSESS